MCAKYDPIILRSEYNELFCRDKIHTTNWSIARKLVLGNCKHFGISLDNMEQYEYEQEEREESKADEDTSHIDYRYVLIISHLNICTMQVFFT